VTYLQHYNVSRETMGQAQMQIRIVLKSILLLLRIILK